MFSTPCVIGLLTYRGSIYDCSRFVDFFFFLFCFRVVDISQMCSFALMEGVSDSGLISLADNCNMLSTLNISNLSQVFLPHNISCRMLSTLNISKLLICGETEVEKPSLA